VAQDGRNHESANAMNDSKPTVAQQIAQAALAAAARKPPDHGETRRVATCLESVTLQRLAECFAGRACRRCGLAAARLAHGRFYCDRHFRRDKARSGEGAKVYKCRVG
jgi:hypothetical protein